MGNKSHIEPPANISILSSFRLDGKTALVTGSGRGIGRIAGIALSEAGAKVILTDIDLKSVKNLSHELKKLGRDDIAVIAGGVIPEQDHKFLYKSGVSSIFGPGSIIAESAIEILKKLMK